MQTDWGNPALAPQPRGALQRGFSKSRRSLEQHFMKDGSSAGQVCDREKDEATWKLSFQRSHESSGTQKRRVEQNGHSSKGSTQS